MQKNKISFIFLVVCLNSVNYVYAIENIPVYINTFNNYQNGEDPITWADVNGTFLTSSTPSTIYKLDGDGSSDLYQTGLSYYNGHEVTSLNYYTIDAVLLKNAGVEIGVVGGVNIYELKYYKFSWSNGASKLKLTREDNGNTTVLAWGTNTSAMPNWAYRMFRLQVIDNVITGILYNRTDANLCWTDDNLTIIESISAVDNENILSGGAGVYAKYWSSLATNAQADYFRVSQPATVYKTCFAGYNNNNDPNKWTDANDCWLTIPNTTSTSYQLNGSTGTSGIAYYTDHEITRLDYYTVDAAFIKGEGDGPGIIGGVADYWSGYYMLWWNYNENKIQLIKKQDGTKTIIATGTVTNAFPNNEYRLLRLEVLKDRIAGKIYSKTSPTGDWEDNNLTLIDSISFTDANDKMMGGAGLYGIFGTTGTSNLVSSNYFKVKRSNVTACECDPYNGQCN
jgi:hypothetical protein